MATFQEKVKVSGSTTLGSTADAAASAVVDVVSTTQGVAIPRMTTAQRNAISSPLEGLQVYDTDIHAVFVRGSAAWHQASQIDLAEALTNKNLASSTNTLTGATAASFANTGTVTLFTASDTVVGKATTDVLTNKDIDGGTASNTLRLTVPKNTTTNVNALTRKEATLVYDTTLGQLKIDDGATLTALTTATRINFSAYKNSGSNTFTSASFVQITFDAEVFDNGSYYDTTASRFTPLKAGQYFITVTCFLNGTAGDKPFIYIAKNGGTSDNNSKEHIVECRTTAANISLTVTAIVDLNGTTDYVEVYGKNSTGNTITVGNGVHDTYFSGFLIN